MQVKLSKPITATVAGVLVAGASIVASTPAAHAGPRNDFEMPFPCGQVWQGATYAGHGQGDNGGSGVGRALDLNHGAGNSDTGMPVVASLGGTVHRYTGSATYGNYIYVDHGSGWRTMYAHLSKFAVADGAKVSQGQRIGYVGSTGNAKTSHLHYEQQQYLPNDGDGVDYDAVSIWFHGAPLNPGYSYTYNGPSYTSKNCGAKPTIVDTGVSAVVGAHGSKAVFTRNSAGRLYTNVTNSQGAWGGWVDRDAAILGSGPDATSRTAGTYDVVARRTDGTVIIKSKTSEGWQNWRVLAGGLKTKYAPAIVSYNTKTIYVYAVRATDGQLMSVRWHSGDGFGKWGRVGTNTGLTSGPDATKINSSTIAVAFRGPSGNIRIAKYTIAHGWTGAANWGAPKGSTKAGVAPAIASRRANSIDLMVGDKNGVLHRKINKPSAGWSTTGLPKIKQGPDLTATTGHLQLFARNSKNTPVTATWTSGKGWTTFRKI